jgi:23S rRNA (adenine2503-C2)-methyltransferase
MTELDQKNLFGLSFQQLTSIVENFAEPPYRARQLFAAVYGEGRSSVEEITTLPASFRARLTEAGFRIARPTIDTKFSSIDGTIRYLIGFDDGQSVETVWMPEGDDGNIGEDEEGIARHRPSLVGHKEPPAAVSRRPTAEDRSWHRATICVSSQVGCAVNCQFCMTALLGIQRNLTPGEIVGQVVAVLRDRGVEIERDRINLVFMGQGEPFLNYDAFMQAVRLLVEGIGIPESRMTVSTSGIVPRIYDFAKETVRPRLAISLNGSNDLTREKVMPINRKWNIAALLEAAHGFPLRRRERLTFEYVLLDGVNDSVENALEVATLLRGLRAKVNLIALNPGPEISFGTPADERVFAFQQTLINAGVPTFIRRPRGRDIYAACGQLKKAAETELVRIG